jgi:hypothetical protein
MRHLPFLLYLTGLSALSGWLLSRMSWIGRVGVNLFHQEYKFLKVWYQAAGVVLAVWLVLFFLQLLARRRAQGGTGRAVQIISILIAVGGLWMTYTDFRTDFTHNILKERFHLGAYLFWIGWISISLYLLVVPRVRRTGSEMQVERR